MNRAQLLEFKKWKRKEQSIPRNGISKKKVLEAVERDLSIVSQMGAEEYTLYRKWLEIQDNEDAISYKRLMEDDTFRKRYDSDQKFRDTIQLYLMGFSSRQFKAKTKLYKPEDGGLSLYETLKGVLRLSPDDSFKPSIILKSYKKIEDAKRLIWKPIVELDECVVDGTYDETQSGIFPTVVQCKSKSSQKEFWNIYRNYLHSQENKNNVGGSLYFIVESCGKILGLFALSPDFLDLRGRDDYIGWSGEVRTKKPHVMINHTAIASTILPTQPLGFNYAGGKLIALMAMSDVVEKAWQEQKGHVLVGVTTTSLYGANAKKTQYSDLEPYWKSLGESAGDTSYDLTKETRNLLDEYLLQEDPQKYWEWNEGKNEKCLPMRTAVTQRSIAWAYHKFSIPKSVHRTGHKRGIYFAPLYHNFREFLKKEISEKELVHRTDIKNDVDSLSNYWKEAHAIHRILFLNGTILKPDGTFKDLTNTITLPDGTKEKRPRQNRTHKNYDIDGNIDVFYSDMVGMSWEEAKKKYLPEVGNGEEKQKV